MKILTLLLIAGLFGGCALIHPTDPYASVHVRGFPSLGIDTPYQSPRIHEGPLKLKKAIEIALANNPEVSARRWDRSAAQANREQVSGSRLPRIGIVSGYAHHLDEQRLLPVGQPGDPAILSRDIVSSDIVLTMPLFTGGRLINQVKAADFHRLASEQRLSRSREELAFNVSSIFNSILAQEQVIESLEFSRKTLMEHINRIDALIAAQKAARVDRMRMEVRMADIEQQLVREKNLYAIQHRAFLNLLGLRDIETQISLQGDLEMGRKIELPETKAAFLNALESRGDYLAARSSLEAQAKNVDIARSGRWPTLSLQGAYGERWAVGSTIGTGDKEGDVGRIGLVMEVPIFEGGQVNAGIQEQRAALAAAQERLRSLELHVRLEVETAMSGVKSSGERAAAVKKSITLARESLRIEQQKYNLGKGAIVDVLDAQAALLESETTYYRILAEYHTALAQLKLAMGVE